MRLVYRPNPFYRRYRRVFDIIVSIAALCIAAPVLAVAAAAIAIEDGFPVIYRQRRVGRFERTFVMYKLRTMKKALCGDRPSPSSQNDERLTRVGRFLRRTSLDELPQLLNVLRGEMSIVGPRPEMPFIVKGYERWQHLRHLVEPGLTCIWQTSCRSNISLDRPEATLMDLEYIRTASPAKDGALIVKTFASVLNSHGAY